MGASMITMKALLVKSTNEIVKQLHVDHCAGGIVIAGAT